MAREGAEQDYSCVREGSILFARTGNAKWGSVCRGVAVFCDGDPDVDEVKPRGRCRRVVDPNMRVRRQC